MPDFPDILFVEDDDALRLATVQAFELSGLSTRAFADAAGALAAIDPGFAGVVVSDIRMPRMDGIELHAAIRAIDPDLPVILITGHGDVPMAVAALKDGAFDFITKPFAVDHLVASIRRAIDRRALVIENRALRAAMEATDSDSPLIGDSPPIVALRATIRQLAEADIDVLVEGETGTGKELVAAMLHRQGHRRARPFVAVNCGALPDALAEVELFGHEADSVAHTRLSRDGQIVAAHGGTLLLDEIDSMPLALQTRLLRVLEEREVQPIGAERPRAVDIRVVATSKVDLAAAAAVGRFRADLYYRLSVVRLRVPPLREREGDVLRLFAAFAEEARRQFGKGEWSIDAAASRRLRGHDWPGNVRELRNFAFESVLGVARTEDEPPARGDLPARVAEFEAAAIEAALRRHDGNIARVLSELGVPRKTLYDKMTRHGILPARFRRRGRAADS